MTAPHRYRVVPANPGAHLYEVSVTVEAPEPGGQVVSLPAWIPGSYLVREYAKHVVSMRAESGGQAVAVTKLDNNRWQAAKAAGPLTFVAEVYAFEESVRGAHLDTTHAYFNGTCVFFCVDGQDGAACEVDIAAPAPPVGKGWRVYTSMRPQDVDAAGFGRYTAADYAELIDHPVDIGELTVGQFEVRGIPHRIAIRGHDRADMLRIRRDLTTVCEQHMQLLGPPGDLDRYLFLMHMPGSGYSGLEHRWSSSNVCARDCLPVAGDDRVDEGYRTFLGLVSHEYFHLWNVKRMKPAAFTPCDLSREAHTTLLWVYEGVTSYYDDLALVRAGLIKPDSYLELVGRAATRVLRGAGRLRQSVAESSFDTWTKFYQQDANAPNAVVSYYAKGSLVATALDLTLRRDTAGRTTLDDVMRECWARWGESGKGMPEDGFEKAAAEVSGLDLAAFFSAYVHGTDELPLAGLFETVGVAWHQRAASGPADKGGKKADDSGPPVPWLGAQLEDKAGRSVFTAVHNNSPAERAGIAPGDVAVALGGFELTAANADKRLRGYAPGEKLAMVVFRGDALQTTTIELGSRPETTCWLELMADADAESVARRNAWLHIDQ